MEKKRQVTFFKVVSDYFITFFVLLNEIIGLARLEAQLAQRSLVKIVILAFVLGALLVSTWLCFLGLIFIFLTSMQFSWLISLGLITIFNVLFLIIICLMILKTKDKLFFRATRRQISNLTSLERESQ